MFRAYIPPTEPRDAAESTGHRNRSVSGVFHPYIPQNTVPPEPPVFSLALPPATSPLVVQSFAAPPLTSTSQRGSYQHDLDSGEYPLSWASLTEMEAWLRKEDDSEGISFLRKEAEPNRGKKDHQWITKHIWVCARMGTGGKSKYVLKHPERQRTIPNKRVNCPCRVVGKTYPGTTTILRRYTKDHSHPIGSENLIFNRIPPDIRHQIEQDLRASIRPSVVVNNLPSCAQQIF